MNSQSSIDDLIAAITDADVRCNQWLADGNAASEVGNKSKANRCYDKSQFWLDCRLSLQEKLDELKYLATR